ncbi:hypothetical protein AA13595_2694 [Gluconacetobacter johannae DSM 13595]|nr:hypothetical protein AA13595_2694 [Gluconacetobacter johannae DSM 13595]
MAMLDDWLSPREARPTDRNNFLVFLLFHLYIYICAFSAADLIIDSTRVSYDRHAREEAETGLHTLLGRQISLDGAKPSFDMSQLDLKCSKVDRDLVEQFLRMILPKNIDNACHAFLHQAMNDTFMEWEKNEFYSSGMRGVLVSKIAELDNVNHRLNNVSNQCDHVVHERDEARNLLQLEVTQREGLLQDLKQLHSITNERDSFAHERDEARNLLQLEAAQREGLLQDLKQLHSECNRLEALAQDSARESAAQAERFETLSQENQRLLVELDRQRTACGRHVYAVQQHLDIVQQRYSHFWPRLAFGALMAHVFLSLARRAARRHEWSRAASWYRALLARAPLNFAAWRQYGNMQREQGHLDEAARAYAITLLRYPQDEEVRGWERQINLQRQKERSPEHS